MDVPVLYVVAPPPHITPSLFVTAVSFYQRVDPTSGLTAERRFYVQRKCSKMFVTSTNLHRGAVMRISVRPARPVSQD